MITQDAYATSTDMLEQLVKPLADQRASMLMPSTAHKGAAFFCIILLANLIILLQAIFAALMI